MSHAVFAVRGHETILLWLNKGRSRHISTLAFWLRELQREWEAGWSFLQPEARIGIMMFFMLLFTS
jgi:hypothetical protein